MSVLQLLLLISNGLIVWGSRPSTFMGTVQIAEGELHQPAIRTGYACEGSNLVVKCGQEETIQIIRANYGRFSIAICNDDGETHWSVNCKAPKTGRILQNKCDRLNSCNVPVTSDLFGDPCPGTHKYVEIHYTCSPKYVDTTRRPLRPYYLESPNQRTETNRSQHILTLPNIKEQKLKRTSSSRGNGGRSKPFNARIPILVATTTSTPKRIPITTPKPTTSSTTTQSTVSTTIKEEPMESQSISSHVNTKEYKSVNVITVTNIPSSMGFESFPGGDIRREDIPDDQLNQYCHAISVRNLYWKLTKKGQIVIQPCPNGATGLARWRCSSVKSSILSDNYQDIVGIDIAKWAGDQPDMSDCKSVPMTNLEVKVRQEDPENVIASSLARLTGTKKLYGGDLQSAVGVMRTVANRIQYLLQQKSDKFYKKEAFIQEVLLNIVRSGSNLLDVKNKEAWEDLEISQQMKICSSLLLAMEETAFLFAEVTNKPEILMESSYNILMAISVLNVRDIRHGSSFPLNNYEEPYGTIEDSIFLPLQALERNTQDNLVKAVFFSFKQLDIILSRSDKKIKSLQFSNPYSKGKILNSRVISASLVRGKHVQLPQTAPVSVSLKHLQEEGMTNPTCVFWDLESSSWSNAGCNVVHSNKSRTICECNHLTNFALLMEEQSAPTVIQLPAFHVEIIVASVLAVVLLITFLVFLKFRAQIHKFVLKNPCFKEEKKSLETCHKSQSFFTGINLMPTNGGEKSQTMTTSVLDSKRLSQYLLNTATTPVGPTMKEEDGNVQSYDYMDCDRYEFDKASENLFNNQATLPMRAPHPLPNAHITINPYSTQLVDNINRMMTVGHQIPPNNIYQLAMNPQLSQLTNTLRKKKCTGDHPGPCHHNSINSPHLSTGSQRSDSLTPTTGGENDTDDTETTQISSDVVFRAVSPHGHVYWEIDPKRPNKIARVHQQVISDEDTSNDLHNMSDFSEEDGKTKSERRRRSSSRFSDNRPLISSSNNSPGNNFKPHGMVSPMIHGMSPDLFPLPEGVGIPPNFPPNQRDLQFNSLQRPEIQIAHGSFPATKHLTLHPRSMGVPDIVQDQNLQAFHNQQQLMLLQLQMRNQNLQHLHMTQNNQCDSPSSSVIPEQLQQQVQIPDLRPISVSVKSSEYIMAKIQNHMDQQNNSNHQNNELGEREV